MRTEQAVLPLVLLAGRPNTGKTTLFNLLTGGRQRVGNFPGTTVEKAQGLASVEGVAIEIVDLPGTHSIAAETGDELAAFQCLHESALDGPFRVLCVAEATSLEDDMAFAAALKACGYPVALIVNMMDEAATNGVQLSRERLEQALGVPVALCSARTGEGLGRVRELLAGWTEPALGVACLDLRTAPEARLQEAHRLGRSRAAAAAAAGMRRPSGGPLKTVSVSAAIDRWLFHPVLGPLVLALVLLSLFEALFTAAAPMSAALSAAISFISSVLRAHLPGKLAAGLVCDGALAGVLAVVPFVPQIALLFLMLAILEQSGYLPRAGAMVDRALRPFGLGGRVAIPLLSSFACAIPGVLATRALPSEKERLKTLLLCPLMTCSARVPVYTLIIAAFVPAAWRPWGLSGQALVMGGMYAFGVLMALGVALALKATPLAERRPFPISVLPPYRRPGLRELGRFVWTRTSHFVTKAGRVIFLVCVGLWALGNFPGGPGRLDASWLGQAGRLIQPLFAPLGFDWRLSIAVLASLAAREVFVGTLGTLFALSAGPRSGDLAAVLRAAVGSDGRPLYSIATAVSLLLFFAVSIQCVSTLIMVRRETGGWKWPAAQFAAFFSLAYALAWTGFHLTRALLPG